MQYNGSKLPVTTPQGQQRVLGEDPNMSGQASWQPASTKKWSHGMLRTSITRFSGSIFERQPRDVRLTWTSLPQLNIQQK